MPAAIQQAEQSRQRGGARSIGSSRWVPYAFAFSLGILAMFFGSASPALGIAVVGIGIIGTSLGLGRAVGLWIASRRGR